MAAAGAVKTGMTGMLGISRLAANPMRAGAAGSIAGNPEDTQSHVGELLFMVIVELALLAVLRKKFKKHHGG